MAFSINGQVIIRVNYPGLSNGCTRIDGQGLRSELITRLDQAQPGSRLVHELGKVRGGGNPIAVCSIFRSEEFWVPDRLEVGRMAFSINGQVIIRVNYPGLSNGCTRIDGQGLRSELITRLDQAQPGSRLVHELGKVRGGGNPIAVCSISYDHNSPDMTGVSQR